jgi:hypothetical protein
MSENVSIDSVQVNAVARRKWSLQRILIVTHYQGDKIKEHGMFRTVARVERRNIKGK